MKRYKENLIVFGGALVLAALLVGWNVLWLTQPWKNGEKEIGPGEYMEVRMVETEEGLTLQFTPRGEESNK